MSSLDKIASEYTKFYGNPILDVGSAGAWDDDGVFPNSLVAFEKTFYLYYSGRDGTVHKIGVATIP